LPVYNQRKLSRKTLEGVRQTLESIRTSLILENGILSKEPQSRRLSTTAKAYSLWRFAVPHYRGMWSDMHRLAVAWRLSDAKDVESFRSLAARIPRPSPEIRALLEGAWQSLFGKP
jgi:hypothetical protein